MTKPTDQQIPRVAFFSDSLPERNGTGAYYFDLVHQLKDRIPTIKVFQPKRSVRINWLSIPMPGDPSQRLITPDLFRIRKGLHDLKPNIIIAVTPGPFGFLGYLYAKKHKLTFISAFHTDFEQLAKIYWNPLGRFFANLYLRMVNILFCKSADYTLIHNSKLIPQILSLGANKYKIIGTPLPNYYLQKPTEPCPRSVKQICYAGRLAAEKNVDTIIQAAKHFKEIQFIIVGEGPLKKRLIQTAKGMRNLKFTGWLKRDDLIQIVDQSNCLLLPSKLETFGSVAYEAMARGRPTIVSKNSGIIEWDCLRKHILVLNDTASLIESIESLIDMKEEARDELSKNSRQAALEFNQMTLNQWVELLENCIS